MRWTTLLAAVLVLAGCPSPEGPSFADDDDFTLAGDDDDAAASDDDDSTAGDDDDSGAASDDDDSGATDDDDDDVSGPQTFVDPLTDASVAPGFATKDVDGGSFSSDGWQATGGSDQLVIGLDVPIAGDGTVEIDVTNFDASQYSAAKHQIVNLYTTDNGSQDVFDTNEAWWNIRTGTNYGTGLKFLASANGGDEREEVRLIEDASWDVGAVYTWTVTWDSDFITLGLDGDLLTTLAFDGRVSPLQYVFVGKDNVYVGQTGPIYSNLRVTYTP